MSWHVINVMFMYAIVSCINESYVRNSYITSSREKAMVELNFWCTIVIYVERE